MATPPFKVKAVFDYTSTHDDDLNFPAKEIITVTAEEDDDWYYGEYVDASGEKKEGIFPKNFVERIVEVPQRPVRSGAGRKKTLEQVPAAAKALEEPEPEPQPEVKSAPPAVEPAPIPAAIPTTPVSSAPPAAPAVASPPKIPVPTFEEPAKPKVPVIPKPQAAPSPSAAASPPPAKKAPPPVAEKSETVTTSFKDRLALFNKAAAAPVAPFNPGKPPPNFAKKPWVPPPPSKNAFIPPPNPYQNAPKPRRDEETPAPAASQDDKKGESEEPIKVTSLRDRIALLQTVQLDPTQQSKPKRPPKPKRMDSDKSAHSAVAVESPQEERPAPPIQQIHEEDTEGEPKEAAPPKSKPKKSVEITRAEENDDSAGDADLSSAADPPRPRNKMPSSPLKGTDREDDGDDEGANDGSPSAESAEEEEEEVDPEVARRLAIMARMAKVSGGMGMHGVLMPGIGRGGMPPPPAPPKKKSQEEKREEEEDDGTTRYAAPVPIFPMGLPGMAPKKPPVVEKESEDEEEEPKKAAAANVISKEPEEVVDVEDVAEPRSRERERAPSPESIYSLKKSETNDSASQSINSTERSAPLPPPVPEGRPTAAPPQVPRSRPDPSPSEGSATDDEMSTNVNTPAAPSTSDLGTQAEPSVTPSTPSTKRTSYFGGNEAPSSPPPMNKRASYISRPGAMPPIPTGIAGASSPPSARAPPPPPPTTQPPVPRSRQDESQSSEEEITEYEADYDTDMANKVAHKDALRPHGKSLQSKTVEDDDDDETPLPSPTHEKPAPPRSIPPPPPPAGPPHPPGSRGRQSLDQPRPSSSPYQNYLNYEEAEEEEEDTSSYFGAAPSHPPPPPLQPPPPLSAAQSPPETRRVGTATSRTSTEISRGGTSGRRSVDQSRPLIHNDFIAKDVDLAEYSQWWRADKQLPPSLESRRKEFHSEVDITEARQPDGSTTIEKSYYILFHDYSQTVINVSYDRSDPSQATITQRHEAPPSQPRQDQLEDAYTQFGVKFYEGANSRVSTVVKDGDPLSLISELFSIIPDALPPAGTRAFGALVYANLANASVQQHDEIRPGDIITFRHARFQGHKGGLHQKYAMEVGKPEHFAVVVDWDGTKKKLRAFEQGREKGKVKIEAFRIGDLKSGEVKIWRVMGRRWIGWDQ